MDREEFFIRAIRGIYTLHEHGVVHSNATLANILLSEDGSVKIHGFENAVVYYQMKSVFFQRGVNFDMDLFEDSFRQRGYLPAMWKGEMYDPRIVRLPLGMCRSFFFLARALLCFVLLALKGLMIDGPVDNIEIICRELARRSEGWVKLIEQRVKFS